MSGEGALCSVSDLGEGVCMIVCSGRNYGGYYMSLRVKECLV